MSEQGQYGGQSQVPEQYRAIAQLVSGYVDDKLAEFEQRMVDAMGSIIDTVADDRTTLTRLHGNISGLMSAVAELQANAGESMPEHVYKQFIRAEAERLRIVKPVRERREPPADTESPAPTPTPDNVT